MGCSSSAEATAPPGHPAAATNDSTIIEKTQEVAASSSAASEAAGDSSNSPSSEQTPEAICEEGYKYACGEEVEEDAAKAVLLFQKSADKGLKEAQYNLAVLYFEGRGVSADHLKAAEYLLKACSSEDGEPLPLALTNLGYCYESGEGVAKDMCKAAELYEKASSYGSPEAKYNLAHLCLVGSDEYQQDEPRAAKLFQEVAEELEAAAGSPGDTKGRRASTLESAGVVGHEEAIGGALVALGIMHEQGNGVAQDDEVAAKHYRKACNLGHPVAQYNYGVMTLGGRGGLTADLKRAKALFKLAAGQGYEDAQKALDSMKKQAGP